MNILGDSPITKNEEDRLNRANYAKHIADGILKWNSTEILCIAIQGQWGSGKTSIINLCLEEISSQTKNIPAKDKPLIVRFQPWLISGQEQLINKFLKQLRLALNRPDLSDQAKEAAKR